MTEEPKTAEVVSFDTFHQRRLNRHNLHNPHKPLNLPKPTPLLTREWDDELMTPVDTVYVDRDPGDER